MFGGALHYKPDGPLREGTNSCRELGLWDPDTQLPRIPLPPPSHVSGGRYLLGGGGKGSNELGNDGLHFGVTLVQVLGEGAHEDHHTLPHSVIAGIVGRILQELLKYRQQRVDVFLESTQGSHQPHRLCLGVTVCLRTKPESAGTAALTKPPRIPAPPDFWQDCSRLVRT